MATYSVSRGFRWQGDVTDKVTQLCRMFGLTLERLTGRSVRHTMQLHINDGDIVYITGPSGAGKSVLLRELENAVPASQSVNLARISLPSDRTVIECIKGELLAGLKMLSIAGLNDCFCYLNQPANLSDGEKYRFRLAKALTRSARFIFADEFCSELDRVTAAVISHRLHTFAKQSGTTFVLASSHDDILLDLAPDVLVVKHLSGPADVIYKRSGRCEFTTQK